MKKVEQENGQVMVIIVAALVALLGFAALAVDGGMLFSERRYDQNAADDSALAGAGAVANYMEQHRITLEGFSCADGRIQTAMDQGLNAALQRAASNNFVLAENLDSQHGVHLTCGFEALEGYSDYYVDVHVMITSQVESSFAHIIFGGDLQNTVEAVARVRPRTSYAFGFAIASLNPGCSGSIGGIEFDGNVEVRTISSGIFSNSCMRKNGGVFIASERGIYYMSSYSNNGSSGAINPSPAKASQPLPDWDIPAPNCLALDEKGSVSNGGSIVPGRYTDIEVKNSNLVMAPGLYCISGSFKATGGTTTVSGRKKDGVTLFLINGEFTTTGNATIQLRAPMEGAVELPPALKGVLVYLAPGNQNVAAVRGNSVSSYRGMVFAPDGTIEIGGVSSMVGDLSSQFIADTIKVHGTSGMNIEFDEEEVWSRPASLELHR